MDTAPRRLGLAITGVAGLLVLGVSALLVHGLMAGAREERLRHQLMAERLFDELERELTDLTVREEQRSFLEYRYRYVPGASQPGQASLARSPLSRVPEDPAVVGWFQVEPDGSLTTPLRPPAGEAADDGAEAVAARLARALAGVSWADLPPAPAQPAPALTALPAAPAKNSLYSELNRAVSGRQRRDVQSQSASWAALEPFQGEDTPAHEAPRLGATAAATVGVVVTPLVGSRPDPDHLVLQREVRLGEERWRQGLVLSVPDLARRLEERVLADAELARWVTLDWDGGQAGSARYTFAHTFAAPFGDLSATARLARIPGLAPSGEGSLLVMAALLVLVTAGGGALVARTVAARLELARRRSDFVAAVSHELKTPLTSIRMMAEILRDGMVPSEARRQEYYGVITAEAERLSRLVGNVLELARLERGTRAVERVPGSVAEVVGQVVDMLGPHAATQGFAIVPDLPGDLPPVPLDRDALLQVLVNLVDNAMKFAAAAEDRRIHLGARPGEAEVLLWVRDHGPGVPPDQLRRIFEPFYRGERELTRRTRGTGIGLALVAGLVTRMGGRVEARNLPDGFEVGVLLRRMP